MSIRIAELRFTVGAPPKLNGMRAGNCIRSRSGDEKQGYEIDYIPGEAVYVVRQYSAIGVLLGTFQFHGGPGMSAQLEEDRPTRDAPTLPIAGATKGTSRRQQATTAVG